MFLLLNCGFVNVVHWYDFPDLSFKLLKNCKLSLFKYPEMGWILFGESESVILMEFIGFIFFKL